MILLVYCIVSLFYDLFVLSLALHDMFHTPVARYSPFLLKVSLNANRLNYQKKPLLSILVILQLSISFHICVGVLMYSATRCQMNADISCRYIHTIYNNCDTLSDLNE